MNTCAKVITLRTICQARYTAAHFSSYALNGGLNHWFGLSTQFLGLFRHPRAASCLKMSSKVQPRDTHAATAKMQSRVGPEEKFFVSSRGRKLHCSYWRPNAGVKLRGLVFLCHGFAEHLQWYEDLALRLTGRDLLVFGHDHGLDYLSEKFYQALTLDVVPVVLGGGPYEDIAPPDSYVDALAFPSPKHLAKYLKQVATDRDAYNSFFAWKLHYMVELGHPFLPLVCDLCSKLHDPASLLPPTTTRSPMEQAGVIGAVRGRDGNGSYPDIEAWFVRGSGCRRWWQGAKDLRRHGH